MFAKPFTVLILCMCAGASFAQVGILKNMERHQWEKAEVRLRKTLSKDTLNPAARYLLSRFFFASANPKYDIDSAYHYAVTALDDFSASPAKSRDRLLRLSVDSLRLVRFRAEIDSAAFELARERNTEKAYLEFLSHFPSAVQAELARELRDEVAFQDALKQRTHQAFSAYLNRYPGAKRAGEARAHYDTLIYRDRTQDGRLASYEKFLAEYPQTPFRDEIHGHIFQVSTADGTVESLLKFVAAHPDSRLGKRARQMAFHILAEEEDPEWPQGFLNDSLKQVLSLRGKYLVPVLRNNLYGFIDSGGREVLKHTYKRIPEEYFCGHITGDVLLLDGNLVSRSGSLIYRNVDEVVDLGLGFLKIATPQGVSLIHKGGFLVSENVEDVRILQKQYLAVRRNGAWRLLTLTGRPLDARLWDEVSTLQDVVILKRGDKVFIASSLAAGRREEGHRLTVSEPLDELKAWPPDYIWGRSGNFQGVMTPALQSFIGFDQHVLTQTPFGATAALPNGWALYDTKGKRSSVFEELLTVGERVAVRVKTSWFLFDPVRQELSGRAYDAVKQEGPFMLGILADSVYAHFMNGREVAFFRPASLTFIPGMDSVSFLMVDVQGERKMFDHRGNLLFSSTVVFDAIAYAGQGAFVITRKDKKGLIDITGKIILPVEYDAIGSVQNQVLSLLKNRRFGAFHLPGRKLIKPQYDRNLIPYGKSLLITYRNDAYGFIDWSNKRVSDFQFDEVLFWQDSTALVRMDTRWGFYDLNLRKITESQLRRISLVRDGPREKIAIVQRNNQYGVVSNVHDVIIPFAFSEIVNLGSAEEPLYFTEKHIHEASLFIVIYYNARGEMLRKEIYDDAAEYDRIFCSDP